MVAFLDEACQATKLETLLVWAHNTDTALRIMFTDYPSQLYDILKSANRNANDDLINSFATRMDVLLFGRLMKRGFDVYLLNE